MVAVIPVEPAEATPRRARVVGLVVYAAALGTWMGVAGLPKSTFLVFTWIWLATIAWNNRRPWRTHLAFPRDWWIPLAVLTVYLYSRGLADDLGFATVHVTEPIEVDRALFGGTLPTAYFQARLCGVPCERTMPPEWYDVVLTTFYYSHFFVAPVTAAVLWVRNRPAWLGFMRRYLSLNVFALLIFITYPVAPPWWAAQDGVVTSNIARITGRGWYDLSEAGFHRKLSALGNPVAAMPSLHAGIAMFVAVYGMTRLRSRWRWALLLYPLIMSFALVYYAEHYVVDIVAGYAAAGVVLLACTWWERRRGVGSRRGPR
jgi:hypothetical protein